jgi:23S rRNA (guanosine2251-2'-O)-methyltransferase
MSSKILFGFHAIDVRIKIAPQSVLEVLFDTARHDNRMTQFLARANTANVRLIESDAQQLQGVCSNSRHQGVVALVQEIKSTQTLNEMLEDIEESNALSTDANQIIPLLLVLDEVTDPHNLGACLRVADGAGVHAVIAPKDRSVSINATVAKVASGAAETVPYFMVTNLARTLGELKDRGIWVIGTSDAAEQSIYDVNLRVPTALVLGSEGSGLRHLTAKTCDSLVRIPMCGAIESLNVSVASAICLYESVRQRTAVLTK